MDPLADHRSHNARGAALRELSDRAAVHDVLLRYAQGVDRRDFDLVASLFTEDATYHGMLGIGTIETALANLRGSLPRYAATMHVLGNHLAEIDGDTGESETYAIAYHRLAQVEPGNLILGVRYLDRLRRRGERWLITQREVKMEWRRYAVGGTAALEAQAAERLLGLGSDAARSWSRRSGGV